MVPKSPKIKNYKTHLKIKPHTTYTYSKTYHKKVVFHTFVFGNFWNWPFYPMIGDDIVLALFVNFWGFEVIGFELKTFNFRIKFLKID